MGGKSHIKPQKLKIHRHFKMAWHSETVRKANLVVISNTLLGNNIFPPKVLEDDFPFPKVGYVGFLVFFFHFHHENWERLPFLTLTMIFHMGFSPIN